MPMQRTITKKCGSVIRSSLTCADERRVDSTKQNKNIGYN
jgi:hypothetical protein